MVPGGLFVIQHCIPLVDALFLSRKEVVGGIENFNLLDFVAAGDGVHDIHPISDMTEDGVFAVKVRCGHVGDEELASIGPWAGIGHGKNTGAVVFEPSVDFVFKAVAGSAAASAGRIAALDHELLDDAMEGEAVVVTALREIQEVGDGDGGFRWLQSGFNRPFASSENNTDILHGSRVCRRMRGHCQTEKQTEEYSFHKVETLQIWKKTQMGDHLN